MHKSYLLLRNNKEQGPYSLEELLRQSLKPMDLVWVEGKSAGWKYPSEIDALKNHVAAGPIPAEIKKESPATEPVTVQSVPEVKKHGGKKKIYVSMPGGAPPSMPPIEEESFSQKLEKKAEELYRRAQTYAEKKKEEEKPRSNNSTDEDTALQINYARSLDEIKEEYSNWLYEQNRNKKGSKRKLSFTVMATIAILLAGFTTAKFVFSKKQTSVATVESNELAAARKTTVPSIIPAKSNPKSFKRTSGQPAKGKSTLTKKKTKTVSKQKKSTPYANKNKDAVAQKSKASPFPLSDLVKVTGQYASNKNGIPDFIIAVKNNSEEALRFVAVDLYYYQNDGSLAGKNTIYFNGLSPHQSISQKAPAGKNAENVVLKMGLVRSEDGGMYYAKQ